MKRKLCIFMMMSIFALFVGCGKSESANVSSEKDADVVVEATYENKETTTEENTSENAKTDTKTEPETQEVSAAKYAITKVMTTVNDGVFWATLEDGSWAIVNTSSKILYKTEPLAYLTEFRNGVSVIWSWNNDFTVLNSKGEVLFEDTDENDQFYSLADNGDVIYKKATKGFDVNKTEYYILKGGKTALTPVEFEDKGFGYDVGANSNCLSVADGVYILSAGYYHALINTNSGLHFELGTSSVERYVKKEDKVFCVSYIDSKIIFGLIDPKDFSSVTNVDEFISLIQQNGSDKNPYDVFASGDEYVLRMDDEYIVLDKNLNTIQTTSTDSIEVDKCCASNGYFCSLRRGADGNYYITVVDKNGEFTFEPVIIDSFNYMHGDNGYFILERERSNFKVLTVDGKIYTPGDDMSSLSGLSLKMNHLCDGLIVYGISEGYITSPDGTLYALDGAQITEATE